MSCCQSNDRKSVGRCSTEKSVISPFSVTRSYFRTTKDVMDGKLFPAPWEGDLEKLCTRVLSNNRQNLTKIT
jgi:hypothetical protein